MNSLNLPLVYSTAIIKMYQCLLTVVESDLLTITTQLDLTAEFNSFTHFSFSTSPPN